MSYPRTSAGLASLLALVLVGALASPSTAQPDGVRVEDAWSRRAPMVGSDGTAAVYLTLVNSRAVADAIVAATAEVAATTELHESYEMKGMMMMRQVPKFPVKASGKVVLKPGGFHLMLFGLKRELKPGDKFGVVLTLEKAGTVPVEVTVR